MLAALAAVAGIGLILFFHETGHFVAARLARVRVEVFSLGFGPRLWGFRRRGCDFRLSAIPMGGYVRLAGEERHRPPLPGELGAASPGWRFFIFSGGILANFLFAVLMIPVLFRVGVPFRAPAAGFVGPGSPAWRAGIQPGDRLLKVDGAPIHGFEHFVSAVALGAPGQALRVEVERGGEARRTFDLVPEFDETYGLQRVGIEAPLRAEGPLTVAAKEGSAAWSAGLRDGDVLLAAGGIPLRGEVALHAVLDQLATSTEPVELRYRRRSGGQGAGGSTEGVALLELSQPAEDAPPQLGLRRLENRVLEVREGPLAAWLRCDDRILAAGGAPVRRRSDLLLAVLRAGGSPELRVLRDGGERNIPPQAWTAERIAADLWLGPDEDVTVAVAPDSPAWNAGARDGDRLLRVDSTVVGQFEDAVAAVRAAAGRPVTLLLARPGAPEPRSVTVTPAPMPRLELALVQRLAEETVRRDNFLDALELGLSEARRMVREVVLILRRMVSGDVARRNLGGIVTIGQMTYASAEAGLVPLLFFLALLSIQFGVLNLLPIPALDGGHLLFVAVEKVRGRPLGERAERWLNLAGFAAVVAILLVTLSHDIQRLLR